MTKFTEIIIDTNIFIKTIEKELEWLKDKDQRNVCEYVFKILENLFYRIHDVLAESQYINLMSNQINELKRWLCTNVCKYITDINKRIKEMLPYPIAESRRLSVSSKKLTRLTQPKIEMLKRKLRRHKRIVEQIEKMRDKVDKSIIYYSLSCGMRGKKVKVVTTDIALHDALLNKARELRVSDNLTATYVKPGEVSLPMIGDIVRDP